MAGFPTAPGPTPDPPPGRRGPPPGTPPQGEPPPRWATRLLDRLGRRWWLVTAALLPPVAGLVACGLSVAGMRALLLAGLPAAELLKAEIPRAVALCLWPGLAAGGVVVLTAPAWSARPFALLCAAVASAFALDAGAQDLQMTREGRGVGPRQVLAVWGGPTVLGLLATILWLEHNHGARTVRREEDEEAAPPLRLWTPDE